MPSPWRKPAVGCWPRGKRESIAFHGSPVGLRTDRHQKRPPPLRRGLELRHRGQVGPCNAVIGAGRAS